MAKMAEMGQLFRDFCSGPRPFAKMLTIYIEEASPGKGKLFEGKPIAHFHRSLEERVAAANRFVQECEFRGEVVCDTMANEVQTNLDAYPERILIVEKGVVVHRGGAGPLLFFDIDDVLAWCNKHDHRTPEEKAVNKAAQGEDSSEVQECAT